MSVVVLRLKSFKRFRLFEHFFVFDKKMFDELFRIGMPIGLTMLAEGAFFGGAGFLMGSFGVPELAAHQIALNICSVTFMVPLGIAMAGTVRVGHAAGAGDMEAARRAGFVVMALGGAFMTLCGLVMWLMPNTLIGLYLEESDSAGVAKLAAGYLAIAAFFQLFDALQVAGAFALRGLKDTKVPMYLATASYWFIGFTTAVGLGIGLGWRGDGIWIGFVIGLAAASVAMVVRFAWLSRTTGPAPDVENTELEEDQIPVPLAREAA
jgi:MATE family multidrug resistance protein